MASVGAIPPALRMLETVLADYGYAKGAEVAVLPQRGIEVLVATCAYPHVIRVDARHGMAMVGETGAGQEMPIRDLRLKHGDYGTMTGHRAVMPCGTRQYVILMG